MNQKIKMVLWPLAGLICLYIVYDGYFVYTQSESSVFGQRQRQLQALQGEVQKLVGRLEKAKEDGKLSAERNAQIKRMETQYAEMAARIPTQFDSGGFLGLVNTEAKRVGLRVISFRRAGSTPRNLLTEHSFEFRFAGSFAHFVLLLNRLSKSKNLVSVLNLDMKPSGKAAKSTMELEGSLTLQAYQLKKGTGS